MKGSVHVNLSGNLLFPRAKETCAICYNLSLHDIMHKHNFKDVSIKAPWPCMHMHVRTFNQYVI